MSTSFMVDSKSNFRVGEKWIKILMRCFIKVHYYTRAKWLDRGEAGLVGDRVSTWTGSCNQGPIILENYL